MSPSRVWDLDAMRAAAERATGLSDWGAPGRWQEGARRLCDALATEAGLSGAGEIQVRMMLLDLLANRLRVQKALSTTKVKPLEAPVFVLGLPRTGTTLLHGALARHPDVTAPSSVECFYPAGRGESDARAATRNILDAWYRSVPALRAIHAMEVDEPNECGFLLQHSFVSTYFGVLGRIPSYLRWVDSLGPLNDEYEDLARLYALLEARRPQGGRRWILKCPHHLLALDALAKAFPDAKFVWTHREVKSVIPSWCSLVAASRSRFAKVEPRDIGPEELPLWADGVRRATELRAALGDRLLDVSYRRIVADLPGVFRSVCDFAGLRCDAALVEELRAWHAAHPKDRHGVHRYTAEDFGLTGAGIDAAFGHYPGELAS